MQNQNTSEDTAQEIARIKDRIDAFISEHFARGEQVYYLSKLGIQLGSDRLDLEKLTGVKLGTFVRNNFDYHMDAEGQHKNVLVLRSKGLPDGTSSSRHSVPRYAPRFWAAFAVPLAQGEHRFINLSTLAFGPVGPSAGSNADIREIEPQFIAPMDASGSASDTTVRIAEWLDQQKLEPERFIAKPRHTGRDGGTALEFLLNTLDGDQLRRVSLPLDIVKTLHSKPI
jgi:hypothetical protein